MGTVGAAANLGQNAGSPSPEPDFWPAPHNFPNSSDGWLVCAAAGRST